MRGCQAPHPRDASLRRQRRKRIATGTGEPVPVPDITVLVLLADPDNLETRRRLPHGQVVTPVPEVGPARVAVELHPLGRVGQVHVNVNRSRRRR